jgi:uncharacterized membrane protein
MSSTRSPVATLAFLLVVWWLHLHHFLARMPERIATHFDASGAPNGYMARASMGTVDFVFMALLLGVVIGMAFLVRVLPTALINVPHRDYWFAPERRQASHRRMFVHMLWLACLLVAFMVGVNHSIFLTNLRPGPIHLPGTHLVLLLGAFLTALAAWVAMLYRMFPRPRS